MADNHFKTKRSCGEYHAWCLKCRPDIAKKGWHKLNLSEKQQQEKYAPGYVPHPTKTMWERHAEEYNAPLQPRPTVMNNAFEENNINKVQKIFKESPDFTDKQLREEFGLGWYAIGLYHATKRQERIRRIRNAKYELKHQYKLAKEEEKKPRELLVVDMRINRMMTLKEIGDALVPPITRERVRQILARIERREGITFPHYRAGGIAGVGAMLKKPKELELMVALRCRICGKIVEVPESKKELWRLGFCKEHRMSELHYSYYQKDPSILNMTKKEFMRWRYHNDARVHAQASLSLKKYYLKLREDPIKWAKHEAMQKRAITKYKEKRKAERTPKPRPFIDVENSDDA